MTIIRPIGRQVLVELEPLQLMSKGGLHLPETVVYNQNRRPDARWATVLAMGPRCRLGLREGDRVLINAWLNDNVRPGSAYAGKDRRDTTAFLSEDDVFAVEESEAAE